MKYIRRFLILLLVILLIGIAVFVWFFHLREKVHKYTDAPVLKTIVQTGQTAEYNENRNVYWGDLHIHTSWSFDAFVNNVRTTPDDAYNFGKGAAIDHISGQKIQIKRPLDFMAVTDHSEYMGTCLLYTSPSPRDQRGSRMPSSA